MLDVTSPALGQRTIDEVHRGGGEEGSEVRRYPSLKNIRFLLAEVPLALRVVPCQLCELFELGKGH